MPQHAERAVPCAQFFLAPDQGYLEIDLDVHSYAYFARKAFHAFIPRLSTVIFENSFVIQVLELSSLFVGAGLRCCTACGWLSAAHAAQGNSMEELPEVILGCARVSRVDFAQVRTGHLP